TEARLRDLLELLLELEPALAREVALLELLADRRFERVDGDEILARQLVELLERGEIVDLLRLRFLELLERLLGVGRRRRHAVDRIIVRRGLRRLQQLHE